MIDQYLEDLLETTNIFEKLVKLNVLKFGGIISENEIISIKIWYTANVILA